MRNVNSIRNRLNSLEKKLNIDPEDDPTVYYVKCVSEALSIAEMRIKNPKIYEGKKIVYDPVMAAELKRILSLPKQPLHPSLVKMYKELKKECPNSSAWELFDPDGEFDEK